MDFNQTETQTQIAEMVRDFANKHIRPNIMDWDESQTFPIDLFHKMGELGLMGVLVPAEYGGSGRRLRYTSGPDFLHARW